jgi:hypothetical protein
MKMPATSYRDDDFRLSDDFAQEGGGRWFRRRLWNAQRILPFSWLVGPPSAKGMMWSTWEGPVPSQ